MKFLVSPRLARGLAQKITGQDIAAAYAPEIEAIKHHSTLWNQRGWKDLVELKDIKPMMEAFKVLHSKKSVPNPVLNSVVQDITRSLARSAKDEGILFRHLLEDVRLTYSKKIHKELAEHCDTIASAVIDGSIPAYGPAMGTLLSAYEIVDPVKGVAFYMEGNLLQVGGSVIPCMVKSNAPLSTIEEAYLNTPTKTPRVRANMVWAYLKYDEIEKALELKGQIHDMNLSVETFLVSAFVGDAPLKLARTSFWEATIAPHSAAMVRMLNAAWESNNSVSEQLSIFKKYIELSKGLSESAFKPVTYAVTANILQMPSQHVKKKTKLIIKHLKQLINIYSDLPSRSLFLNILLTHVYKSWPNKVELIMPILQAYGADTTSPITYRVRLNALGGINPKDKTDYIYKLWNARCQLPEPISTYDWISLSKADLAVAKSIYNETGGEIDPRVARNLKLKHK